MGVGEGEGTIGYDDGGGADMDYGPRDAHGSDDFDDFDDFDGHGSDSDGQRYPYRGRGRSGHTDDRSRYMSGNSSDGGSMVSPLAGRRGGSSISDLLASTTTVDASDGAFFDVELG